MTKLDLGCFGPLCTEIHLGTFDRIIHMSFETLDDFICLERHLEARGISVQDR